jgi:hypothetical protein
MVSDAILFQVASMTALVGMALGWRGVMTRFSGFYDLPTAWNQIFWGILIGGVYASLVDRFIFVPFITAGLTGVTSGNSISNLVIILLGSVAIHLMLRRARVRKTGSQPTSGWALGLAIGGMTSMYLIFRVLQIYEISALIIANLVILAIITPRCEALICAHHGYRMLEGERWRAVFRSFIIRTIFLAALYFTVLQPLTWIFIIPLVLLAEKNAVRWVWAAVPKPARRRLRRIWAEKARYTGSEEE